MVTAIQLTENHGPVGTVVTIDGTGFTALTAITFTYGGAPITPTPDPTTSGAGGDFSCTVVVPASVKGAHAIVADDGILPTATANFTVEQQTVITESNAQVGDTINVVGTGYATLSLMSFLFNGASITPVGGAVTTDANGGFTTTFVVPAAAAGSRTLTGTDAGTNADSDTIIIDPKLVITENNCIVGDTINFTGSGYASSSAISLLFAGAGISPVSAITTNSNGGFTGQLIVPASVNGSRIITATDGSANADTDTISVDAHIVVSPTSGRIGSSPSIIGTGYAANDTIAFEFDGDVIVATGGTSDASGGFSASITVPTKASGPYTITATDEAMNTDDATFTVSAPTLVLTPDHGQVGDTITLTGANYVPNSTVTVTNIDGDDSVTFTASATGTIPADTTILVPPMALDTYQVNADDGTNNVDADFDVEPKITIQPTRGEAGSEITVLGTGYTNAATMIVRLNNVIQTTTPSSITVDSDGNFEGAFTIPEGTPIDDVSIVKCEEA